MYKVYSISKNCVINTLDDWNSLIRLINRSGIKDNLAHHVNDARHEFCYRLVEKEDGKFYETRVVEHYNREYIIYDELNRVVSVQEILEAVKNYVEPKRVGRRYFRFYGRKALFIFEYRKDPVPFSGRNIWNSRYYRRIKRVKQNSAFLLSCDFPISRNEKKIIKRTSLWSDDLPRNRGSRGWKAQGKKKKQWE